MTASATINVYNYEIFLSILDFFPECQTYTHYSLLDPSFYNHLKFNMFKTQLIISIFLSVFSFFFPLGSMFWSMLPPPVTRERP